MLLVDEELTNKVIGAAIEVHRSLGPGLLESVYERCLAYELELQGIEYRNQVWVDLHYKTLVLEKAYKLDLLVADRLIVELKSVDEVSPLHEAQLLTQMKLSNIKVGLLINFNVTMLKEGLTRRVL